MIGAPAPTMVIDYLQISALTRHLDRLYGHVRPAVKNSPRHRVSTAGRHRVQSRRRWRCTLTSTVSKLPVWLGASDELPHAAVDMPYWVENYLTYAFSPANSVGIYLHFRHVPGKPGKP